MIDSISRWDSIDTAKYRDEGEAIAELLARQSLLQPDRTAILAEAADLVRSARASVQRQGDPADHATDIGPVIDADARGA